MPDLSRRPRPLERRLLESLYPPLIPGKYYGPRGALGSMPLGAGTLTFSPLTVPDNSLITEVSIQITAAGTLGALGKFVFYIPDYANGVLIKDWEGATTFPTDVVGRQAQTISYTTKMGELYLGYLALVQTSTIESAAAARFVGLGATMVYGNGAGVLFTGGVADPPAAQYTFAAISMGNTGITRVLVKAG